MAPNRKGPPSGRHRETGRESNFQPDCIGRSFPGQRPEISGIRTAFADGSSNDVRAFFDELAVELIDYTVEAERRLISSGIQNAQRLVEAATEADLSDDDFASEFDGLLYTALFHYGTLEGPVSHAVMEIGRREHIVSPAGGLQGYLSAVIHPLEPDASQADRLAHLVKRASRRRRRYASVPRSLAKCMLCERSRLAALRTTSNATSDGIEIVLKRRSHRVSV